MGSGERFLVFLSTVSKTLSHSNSAPPATCFSLSVYPHLLLIRKLLPITFKKLIMKTKLFLATAMITVFTLTSVAQETENRFGIELNGDVSIVASDLNGA